MTDTPSEAREKASIDAPQARCTECGGPHDVASGWQCPSVTCVAGDPCDHDHTCGNHRLLADERRAYRNVHGSRSHLLGILAEINRALGRDQNAATTAQAVKALCEENAALRERAERLQVERDLLAEAHGATGLIVNREEWMVRAKQAEAERDEARRERDHLEVDRDNWRRLWTEMSRCLDAKATKTEDE